MNIPTPPPATVRGNAHLKLKAEILCNHVSRSRALNTHIALMSNRADLAFEAFKHHPRSNKKPNISNQTPFFLNHMFITPSAMLQCTSLGPGGRQNPEENQLFCAVQQWAETVPVAGSPGSLYNHFVHVTQPTNWAPHSGSLSCACEVKPRISTPSAEWEQQQLRTSQTIRVQTQETIELARRSWMPHRHLIKYHCSLTTLFSPWFRSGSRYFWKAPSYKTQLQIFRLFKS